MATKKQHALRFWLNKQGIVCAKGPWPKTKAASLNASIRKWQAIVGWLEEGREVNSCGHCATCALCQYDIVKANGTCTTSCPVGVKTRKGGCYGTPYDDWEDTFEPYEKLAAAKAEVAFLESLR